MNYTVAGNVVNYILMMRFPTRDVAQLWIDETFDASVVQVLGIWQSPFRAQMIAKVAVTLDPEIKGAFEDGLNRMKNIYPEEKRQLQFWEEAK